jgi:hypothetical protein
MGSGEGLLKFGMKAALGIFTCGAKKGGCGVTVVQVGIGALAE